MSPDGGALCGASCRSPGRRLKECQARQRLEGRQARRRREARLLPCQAPELLLERRLEELQALFSGFRQAGAILRFETYC